MKTPPAIQSILSDQTSNSELLLDRIIVAFENELINPDRHPESFVALVRTVRKKMQYSSDITHFCDELILFHESTPARNSAACLELIRKYKDTRK